MMSGIRSVLYGRDTERATLRERLQAALDGQGTLVLIAGEAGIGKTSLVDDLAGEAAERGALVLRGHCYDLTATPPYGPWTELLAGLPTTDGSPMLLPQAEEPNASPASQSAQFALVVRGLSEAAGRQPLLLVLEDQHWADVDSLQLARAVARALPSLAALMVMTYRDVEMSPGDPLYRILPHLVRETRPTRINLRRLPAQAIEALVAGRYALRPEERSRLVAYLRATAEGNPFYTEEILRTLEHERLLAPSGTAWTLGDLQDAQVPQLVRQMIDARIAWLDEESRRMLQVAAVIGAEVPVDLWAAVLDAGEDELAPVVEQALANQLLAESPRQGSLRFRHALVRDGVYDSLVLPRRQTWHRKVAELLSSRPDPDPDAVAHHFQRARDPRAAEWLIRSGERASRANAIRDAAERYEQALQLLEGDESAVSRRVWLLCNLAGSYRYTDPARALSYLDRARDLVDRMDDRILTAIVRWNRARIRGFLAEDTRADIDEALVACHALSADERRRVRELGRGVAGSQGALAQWLAHHGRYADALSIGEDCLSDPVMIQGAEHAIELGHASLGIALSQAGLGWAQEARGSFAAAIRCFDFARYHFMSAAAIKWELLEDALQFGADEPQRIERLVADYERVWLQTGVEPARDGDHVLLPVYPPLIISGRWRTARAAALIYRRDGYLRIDALAALAEIARYTGDGDPWDFIGEGMPAGPSTEPGTPFFVRALALQRIAAEAALDEGRPDLALEWIEAHDRWLDWAGRRLDRSAAVLLKARHAEALGDLRLAVLHAEEAVQLATEPRQPLALVAAQRAVARLSRLQDHPAEGMAHIDAAMDILARCYAPYEQALTLAEQGSLQQATRDPAASATHAKARAVFQALGAWPALERYEMTVEPAPVESLPAGPVGDLSPRELDVLRLVARGMTDAEVAEHLSISRRTVAGHLQSIYTKLDVNSRTAAAAWAFERGIVG